MAELWYRLDQLPDLTLNKYAALEEKGVDGVLKKHIAFLRQLNRKGVISDVSFHLYYLYIKPDNPALDTPGNRLEILLQIKGEQEDIMNIPALISASPLSDFFHFSRNLKNGKAVSLEQVLIERGVKSPAFSTCCMLTKSETLLHGSGVGRNDYYLIEEWEMNEDGRLYNMCKMMEAIDQTSLFRIDLYPSEISTRIREILAGPLSILRQSQDLRSSGSRDYEGRNVLKNYEDLISRYASSPHFSANIMVFADNRSNAAAILDAAGSESLIKGKYTISTFRSKFTAYSFLDGISSELRDMAEHMVLIPGEKGHLICRQDAKGFSLNFLPTLFTLEEITPFFRFPALYDGEVIQIPKETAPAAVSKKGSLYLGKDSNGYDVCFPLELFPKHAFVSGVPGSGKTNALHHITSSLRKENIPFLVLEPAKKEYRALLNDPDIKGIYLFSPNADMSFPLHINPFEMPAGTRISDHINLLSEVFQGAFPLTQPMPMLLDPAIESVYRENGWLPDHVYTGNETNDDGTAKQLPTMSMLYRQLEEEIKQYKYDSEISGNLESALKVRIGNLLKREMGDVFDVPESTFPPEKWLTIPAIVELEAMGSGPANFLTLVLLSLIREALKVNPSFSGDLRHVILIEEAHNLIGPDSEEKIGDDANPKTAATAFVVKMLAEVRALHEGIIIADQLPTVMAPEVLKNTGLKLGLRITSADDRQVLGSTMAATGMQLEQMSTFEPGEALIFYEGLMRPFRMRINLWLGNLEKKLRDKRTQPKNDSELRLQMIGNDEYTEQNNRSFMITGIKYYRLYEQLKTEAESLHYWLTNVYEIVKEYTRLSDRQSGILTNRINASDEEAINISEMISDLGDLLDEAQNDTRKINYTISLIQKGIGYINTLERLKNGRWKRFGISPDLLDQVTAMQGDIYVTVAELDILFIRCFGEMPDYQKTSKEMRKVDQLISRYVKNTHKNS